MIFSCYSAVVCSECCVAYLTAFSKAIRTLTLRRSVNNEAVICWVSFWNVSFCWMLWCVPFSHSNFSRAQYKLLNAEYVPFCWMSWLIFWTECHSAEHSLVSLCYVLLWWMSRYLYFGHNDIQQWIKYIIRKAIKKHETPFSSVLFCLMLWHINNLNISSIHKKRLTKMSDSLS